MKVAAIDLNRLGGSVNRPYHFAIRLTLNRMVDFVSVSQLCKSQRAPVEYPNTSSQNES